MITQTFTFESPATIEDAVASLGRSPQAKVLAGGHSLIPLIKLGLAEPKQLIDLRRIRQLRDIRSEDGGIVVGALATHRSIADHAAVSKTLTALAEAAAAVGDLQVRSRGTIGGSLAHADPAADEPAPTLAFDATIRVIGPKGRRDILAREFFKGPFETGLAPNEIVIEVRFPALAGRSGSAYAKFAHPASGFAIVGVAAVATVKGDGTVERAAIAVTGAAPSPFRATAAERAIVGTRGDANAVVAAAAKAADGVEAMSDLVASAEFRRHLVTVYARRALERAIEHARG